MDIAAGNIVKCLKFCRGFVNHKKDIFCAFAQQCPFVRQMDIIIPSYKKFFAKFSFKIFQLFRQGGLGYVKPRGGSCLLYTSSTAERMTGQSAVSSFYVKASSPSAVDMAVNTVERFLLQETRDEDAYTVSSQSDVLDTMDDVNSTMSLLLGGIAAISPVSYTHLDVYKRPD